MQYDLAMIAELCDELGIRVAGREENEIELDLGHEAILHFENWPDEDDCLMGFLGASWHTHGEMMWSGREGVHADLDELGIVAGLADGTVQVCELWSRSVLVDRLLVHRDLLTVCDGLGVEDEVRIRRARTTGDAAERP